MMHTFPLLLRYKDSNTLRNFPLIKAKEMFSVGFLYTFVLYQTYKTHGIYDYCTSYSTKWGVRHVRNSPYICP